jgi:16S rRNA (adenine1518-N6/adenine1519-N6)-dimethyltransferase
MAHEITAKKSLGQHFLNSAKVISAIADAGNVISGDKVLEIGPGTGVLTAELLSRGAYVAAVELDDRSIEVLNTKFADHIKSGHLLVVHHDAATGLPVNVQKFLGKQFKLVANIPYYITGLLLRLYLSGTIQPSVLVFLIQREVAERAVARDGKQSLLSLAIQAYGNPKITTRVPRGAFTPPPTVESAVLAISDISKNKFSSTKHEEYFFEVIKIAFGQKRKTIGSTLRNSTKVLEKLSELGFNSKTRPEEIPVEAWVAATK